MAIPDGQPPVTVRCSAEIGARILAPVFLSPSRAVRRSCRRCNAASHTIELPMLFVDTACALLEIPGSLTGRPAATAHRGCHDRNASGGRNHGFFVTADSLAANRTDRR
jgi:hypothetical protein